MSSIVARVPVEGTHADDILVAKPEPSRLVGLEGDDVLLDGPGSDSLLGGAGDNKLYGGLADDYYTYDVYSGSRDVILDVDPTPGNRDTLIISESLESIGPVERHHNDLVIGFAGEPAAVTIKYFFLDPAFCIERFHFGSRHLSDKDVLRNFFIDPDLPLGRTYDQPPSYISGRVRLTGSEKADRLVAGDAPTYIVGRGGNDLLIGSRHSDVLRGGSSSELLLQPNHSNLLFGGPGNDYYQVIHDWRFAYHEILDYDPTPGNIDTLQLQGDLTGVRFSGGPPGSLYIDFPEQRVIIQNYFLGDAFIIEKIRFDDGTVLTEKDIRARLGLAPRTTSAELSMLPPYCDRPPAQGYDSTGTWLLVGAVLSRLCG